MNMGPGLAIELTIEDSGLADRIAAILQDLNVALVEAGPTWCPSSSRTLFRKTGPIS